MSLEDTLDSVVAALPEDEVEETVFATSCGVCGEGDLVYEDDGTLVDLEGRPHKCGARNCASR